MWIRPLYIAARCWIFRKPSLFVVRQCLGVKTLTIVGNCDLKQIIVLVGNY